jgi:hypothetical protein
VTTAALLQTVHIHDENHIVSSSRKKKDSHTGETRRIHGESGPGFFPNINTSVSQKPGQDDSTFEESHSSYKEAQKQKPIGTFSLVIRTLQSTVLFLLVNTFVVLVLFGIGNYQEFLDTTQMMLLEILTYAGLMTTFISLYFIAVVIAVGIVKKRRHPAKLIFGVVSAAFGASLSMAVSLITAFIAP